MPTRKSIIPSLFLAFLLGLLFPAEGHAHRVFVFAFAEGETVHTDSYYPDGEKVIGGTVRVYDPQGKKLLEGKTDKKGAFSFPVPQKTKLRIVLDASMGHRAEFVLPADELPGVERRPDSGSLGQIKGPAPSPVGPVDAAAEKRLLEEVLDARLKPIYGRLARIEKQKGATFRDVIGGIGYIFGLMGVVLYFKNRERSSTGRRQG